MRRYLTFVRDLLTGAVLGVVIVGGSIGIGALYAGTGGHILQAMQSVSYAQGYKAGATAEHQRIVVACGWSWFADHKRATAPGAPMVCPHSVLQTP